MFSINIKFIQTFILKNNLSINERNYRSFKFWNKYRNTSKSSDSVVKMGPKVSLAYYGLDPCHLSKGKPNPILMYHNLFTSKDMFQNIVKPLAQQTGRTVYLLDMRNHGESPHSDADNCDLNAIARDVSDFMDEFEISKAVLVGYGVGSRAMLRMSLLFDSKVEKVAAIDITPIDLMFGPTLINHMVFTVSSLPKHINLSFARLIVKRQLNRLFRDKTLLQFIVMNLRADENGFIRWKFNLPVIRQALIKGLDRSSVTVEDRQYSGDVLIVSGKYGSMTANTYSELKHSFPNSTFDFYQRFRHYMRVEKPKQLLNVLTAFIGQQPNKVKVK